MTTLAIVEDHIEYGKLLKTIINASDEFNVVNCYDTAEIALIELTLAPVDIVMVDINLPKLSGIELIRKLKGTLPNTQYLICSNHHDNDSLFQSLKAGASGYLLKDSNPQQIINALQELNFGGAPMSPFIARKIVGTFQEPIKANNEELSRREQEVIELLSIGLTYQTISEKLFISLDTVKSHLRNIYAKLHVNNKIQAINSHKKRY